MTELPFLWFFVGVLVGGVITVSGMMSMKQLDSNGVWGFAIEVVAHLWTLAVAGGIMALILWVIGR